MHGGSIGHAGSIGAMPRSHGPSRAVRAFVAVATAATVATGLAAPAGARTPRVAVAEVAQAPATIAATALTPGP